jgi:hypothetical protein
VAIILVWIVLRSMYPQGRVTSYLAFFFFLLVLFVVALSHPRALQYLFSKFNMEILWLIYCLLVSPVYAATVTERATLLPRKDGGGSAGGSGTTSLASSVTSAPLLTLGYYWNQEEGTDVKTTICQLISCCPPHGSSKMAPNMAFRGTFPDYYGTSFLSYHHR